MQPTMKPENKTPEKIKRKWAKPELFFISTGYVNSGSHNGLFEKNVISTVISHTGSGGIDYKLHNNHGYYYVFHKKTFYVS